MPNVLKKKTGLNMGLIMVNKRTILGLSLAFMSVLCLFAGVEVLTGG